LIELYNQKDEKSTSEFAKIGRTFTEFERQKVLRICRKFTLTKGENLMIYREKLEEYRRIKGISCKQWAIDSGVSADTISRILHPENLEKDSPRVNTLQDLCAVLGVELWEVFYCGDTSFVDMQAELTALRAERDALLAENAVLKDRADTMHDKIDELKDEIIATHKYYNKL
jgi:transcriptional regulator with XRE-family HTH domain